jgi:hypothetical protein
MARTSTKSPATRAKRKSRTLAFPVEFRLRIVKLYLEKALYIQIWTALIPMLLIKFMRFKAAIAWSLSNLVAFLRWNLFTYRSLWEWLDRPEDTPPLTPPPTPKSAALTVAWSWTANAIINGNLAMHKPKSGFYLVDITEPGCSD